MADETTQAQPTFNVQRIYLKDASLEIPNAPRIFLETDPPNVEVQLDVSNAPVVDAHRTPPDQQGEIDRTPDGCKMPCSVSHPFRVLPGYP